MITPKILREAGGSSIGNVTRRVTWVWGSSRLALYHPKPIFIFFAVRSILGFSYWLTCLVRPDKEKGSLFGFSRAPIFRFIPHNKPGAQQNRLCLSFFLYVKHFRDVFKRFFLPAHLNSRKQFGLKLLVSAGNRHFPIPFKNVSKRFKTLRNVWKKLRIYTP